MKKKMFAVTAVMTAVLMMAGCTGGTEVVNVTVAKVKTESSLAETVYTGTVAAEAMEDVTSNASGKVTEVLVKEGQAVNAGDVLFRLDSTNYQLQANQAKAALNAAKVALSSAQASASSNANVIPDQTASADAHANYERMKALYEAGGISQSEFEAAKSKMDTADAQLAAAKISQKSSTDSAAAQVDSAAAAYALAAQQVADCTVKAPISGKVSQIGVESGSVVSMQVKAMSVVDNSRLKVSVEVLERDVEKIAEGMAAEIAVQALGTTETGTVYQVAPSADPTTGMFRVTVEFDPAESGVLAGMSADVRLLSQVSESQEGAVSVFVPAKSLSEAEGKSYVYVLKGDQVKKQEVTVGGRKNQYVEVREGLNKEDEVVVQAGGDLSDGAKVQVVKNS